MSSLENELVVADEVCLSPQSADEANLQRETNLSFEEWWLTQSGESLREITFEGTLRVDGYVAGRVRSDDGKLILSDAGTIDGDVFVNEAIINGTVRGEIRATVRVELASSARVIGDIETAQLLIQPGAAFQGSCAFTSDSPAEREAA